MDFWVLQAFNGLSFAALLFLLGGGLTLIFGVMRVVNIAQGAFYLVGGYIGYTVTAQTGNFYLGMLGACMAICLLGICMESFLLRDLVDDDLRMMLITFFSLKEWHSSLLLSILIPVLFFYSLDIYWTLPVSITARNFIFVFKTPGLALCLLFLVSFGLTYKEDIPLYGIKGSIWLVPVIITEAFIFYTIMFGFSIEPFLLQFGSSEGYINVLILILTVLSGSLSGRKLKQSRRKKLKKKEEITEISSEPR